MFEELHMYFTDILKWIISISLLSTGLGTAGLYLYSHTYVYIYIDFMVAV